MSLRSQFLLIITGFLLLQGIVFFAYYTMSVLPNVEELETSEAEKSAQRMQNTLNNHLNDLDNLAEQWSKQKLLSNLVKRRQIPQLQLVYGEDRLKEENIHLIYVLDEANNIVSHANIDPHSKKSFFMLNLVEKLKKLNANFLSKENNKTNISGLFVTERGPMFLSTKPILNEAKDVAGHLIIGHFMTQDLMDEISRTIRTDLKLWPLGVKQLPERIHKLRAVIQANPKKIHLEKTSNTMKAYTYWRDISGKPAMVMMTATPRNTTLLFTHTMKQGYAVLLLANFILVLVLLKILEHAIISPTKNLTLFTEQAANHIDAPPRIKSTRQDEIGELTQSLNDLIIAFCEYKNKTLNQAFHYGMYKAKVDIVEDISSSLNQLIPLVENYEKRLWTLSLDDLERLLADLHYGTLDESKLLEVKETLSNYHTYLRNEIEAHRKQVRGIKEKVLRTATITKSHVLHMRHSKTFTLTQSNLPKTALIMKDKSSSHGPQ